MSDLKIEDFLQKYWIKFTYNGNLFAYNNLLKYRGDVFAVRVGDKVYFIEKPGEGIQTKRYRNKAIHLADRMGLDYFIIDEDIFNQEIKELYYKSLEINIF